MTDWLIPCEECGKYLWAIVRPHLESKSCTGLTQAEYAHKHPAAPLYAKDAFTYSDKDVGDYIAEQWGRILYDSGVPVDCSTRAMFEYTRFANQAEPIRSLTGKTATRRAMAKLAHSIDNDRPRIVAFLADKMKDGEYREQHYNSAHNSNEDYLKSPEWQRLRVLVFERDGNRCMNCNTVGSRDNPLCGHHRTYDRYGHELLADLTTLCMSCHSKYHDKDQAGIDTESASIVASSLLRFLSEALFGVVNESGIVIDRIFHGKTWEHITGCAKLDKGEWARLDKLLSATLDISITGGDSDNQGRGRRV